MNLDKFIPFDGDLITDRVINEFINNSNWTERKSSSPNRNIYMYNPFHYIDIIFTPYDTNNEGMLLYEITYFADDINNLIHTAIGVKSISALNFILSKYIELKIIIENMQTK